MLNNHSASQTPRLLWNLKVHYRIHKNPTLVPILNQINPVHAFTHNFPKLRSNIIFPLTPISFEWSLSFRFPIKIFYAFLISTMCAIRSTNLILPDLITLRIMGEAYKLLSY